VRPTEANGRQLLAAIAAFGFPTAPLTASDVVSGTKVMEMAFVPFMFSVSFVPC
jgi:hypothetical protein